MTIFIFLVIYFISIIRSFQYSMDQPYNSEVFDQKCRRSIKGYNGEKICDLLYQRFKLGFNTREFIFYMITTQMIARKTINNEIYIPKHEKVALCRELYYDSKSFCDDVESILGPDTFKDAFL